MSDVRQQIEQLVKSDRVVLFMKGNRAAPQCGFSATVVEILDQYLPSYTTVDVLRDPAIRDGVKEYAQWPTRWTNMRENVLPSCDMPPT